MCMNILTKEYWTTKAKIIFCFMLMIPPIIILCVFVSYRLEFDFYFLFIICYIVSLGILFCCLEYAYNIRNSFISEIDLIK